MSSVEALLPTSLPGEPVVPRRQPRGGGGGGGGNKSRGAHAYNGGVNIATALRPASIPPTSSADSSSTEGTGDARGSGAGERGNMRTERRGVRGRGMGRDGDTRREGAPNGINGVQNGQHVVAMNRHTTRGGQSRNTAIERRSFGGQLTAEEDLADSTPGHSHLKADAPIFVPGQPHSSTSENSKRTGATHRGPRAAYPKANSGARTSPKKSQAPDIAARTHEDIVNGVYECPICTNEVIPSSRVWSCKTCWTVFHLSCIRKWSTNEVSTQAQQAVEDHILQNHRRWRCPGCNLPKDVLPSNYTCWCEKEGDPKPTSGIPPHSCGQTCGKTRLLPKKCPHPCDLPCHAGPCPACTHMGPIQSCFCGKQSTSRRCTDTDYESGWSCGEVCGDQMPCGDHVCLRPCHEGLCGNCEVLVDCRCYCGKVEQAVVCCERYDWRESRLETDGKSETWNGTFDCGNRCQRDFDCGKHQCEKACHPQDMEVPHCPRSPDTVSHCPCGKSLLDNITESPRTSCEDQIPNCDKQCLKILACGHTCQQVCHSDVCMPCLCVVEIGCRCGRTHSKTICHQGSDEIPQCMRSCRATLNCGRHECGERCCPGERKAGDRQATKRKLKPLGMARIIDEDIEAEHICTRSCGRMLKCGNHTCLDLCHKGACGSCREAVFEEITCHCGKTVLQPPLPCGTVPPLCRFDCNRPKRCGHPRIPHNCHGQEEKCPKCPFLSQKPCLCGKKTLKNQPCFLTEVRCGEVCGAKLKCGSHLCRQPCHRPGECEDNRTACSQACGKVKKVCGHPCEEPCHAPSTCREENPCQNKMFITCECQHLKQEVKCNASKHGDGNSRKGLTCDDDCARLARNHKLAQALNIDPDAHKDNHVPYSNDTLKMFRENVRWAQSQEREFRVFAADQNEKRLRFKPMAAHQRAFLHSLSEDFGFDSESLDPEPHRHVAIFKTPRFVTGPMKTLGECVQIRSAEASNVLAFDPQRPQGSHAPYNGFLLHDPRFGLTLEELRAEYMTSFDSTPGLAFDISFLPSEEIVVRAHSASTSTAISTAAIEASIKALKTSLTEATLSRRIAGSIQMCALDVSLNVVRRELDDPVNNGGWSQVAAKGVAPRTLQPQTGFGQKSAYTVLGSRLKDAKKKEKSKKAREREVVDDWEDEIRQEDEAIAEASSIKELSEETQ